MARTLIVNGSVISPTGTSPADVLIDGETIAAVLAPGQVAALGITQVAPESPAQRTASVRHRSPAPRASDRCPWSAGRWCTAS